MAAPHPAPVTAKDLQGFKELDEVLPLRHRLRPCGTASERAGNRQFRADHYAALLLLYFFNPVLTSRHALQASQLAKVQAFCGDRVVWLGCDQSKGVLQQPVRVLEVVTGEELQQHRERLKDQRGISS